MSFKAGLPSRRFFSRAMALWCALYLTLSPAVPLFAQVSEEVQAISEETEAVATESGPIAWDAESISLQGGALATSAGGGEEAPASLQGNPSSQGQAGLAVNASVNPFTGSFSSGLSIRVPAGRQGMQPNLSVGYDSSSGNGLLGVGWGLAKNLIFRSGRNKGTPQFNETDEFYLSLAGSTLKLTPVEHCECASPCATREFRTRTESFSKVIAHYDAAYANRVVKWEVFGKTGMRYTFGTTANSQLPNVQWYLDYTEDTSGNYMEFIYDGLLWSDDPEEDICAGTRDFNVNENTGLQSLNHVLLSEVKYTGNSVKGDDPHNSVQLIYEPRPDVITSYRTTYRQELKDRLKEIEVYGNDALPLWEYVFDYTPSPSSPSQRSLLTSIQQVGRNGAALPPVEFEYQEGDVRWDKTGPFIATIPGQAFLKNSDPGQRYGQGARLVDFNGDGRVDKVDSYTKRTQFCAATSLCTNVSGQCVVGSAACAKAPLSEEFNQVFLNTGTGWSTDALAGVSVPGLPFDERWKNKDGTVQAGPGGAQLADVNGDGLPDKLDFKMFEDYDCPSVQCTGPAFGICGAYCANPQQPSPPQTVNDVYLHAGFGWSDTPHPTLLLPGLPLVERVGLNKVTWRDRGARLVDVNGDGRADKVDFHRDSDETETRDVYLNLGDSDGDGEHDGWLPAPGWSDSLPGEPFTELRNKKSSGWPERTTDLGTRLIDMNADGLPDKVDFYRILDVPSFSGCNTDCFAACIPLLRNDAVFSVYWNTGRGWEQTPDPALSFETPWDDYTSAGRPAGLPFAYVRRTMKCGCPVPVSCTIESFKNSSSPEGTAAIDFNGDGLPDKVDWDNYGTNKHTALLVNDGNGWQEIAIVQDSEFSNNPDFVVLMKGRGLVFDDVNADGLLDGIQSHLDQNAATKKIRPRVGPFPDLLSTVHNGTGGTTRVSYAPAASFVHEPILQDWNGAPERNWVVGHDNPIETVEWKLPFNMQVVASVTASDGRVADESDPDFPRHNYTTRYEYAGGLFDPELGEFQGFRRVRTVEDATDNFSDTYFKQEGRVTGVDLLLPPEEQVAKKGPFSGLTEHALAYEAPAPLGVNEDATPANSILLAETFNQYGAVRNILDPEDPTETEFADIFQIELARSDTWTFESQGGSSVFKLRTAVSYEYDDFGNVTQVLQHGAVNTYFDHVSEQRIFLNDTAQWRLGYALSERVVSAAVEEVLCEPQLVCSPDPAVGCRIRCPWELYGLPFQTYREKQFFYDGLPFQQVGARGLRTKEEQSLSNSSPASLPAPFVTTAQYDYDDYGNLVSITDAKLNTTAMAYDGVFHQFLTQTTNALGHANTVTYNEAGQVLTSTDANGVTSFTDYDDLWRPVRSSVRPAGSADIFVLEEYLYNDALLGDPFEQHTETRTYVDFTTAPTGDYLWSRSYFDGIGRSYETERKGDAGKVIVQRSLFNDRGLVEYVSKPYFDGDLDYYVETKYDSKGRATKVIAPDNSITQTLYNGLETTVIDAEGKKARTKVDAYGRTVAVTEFFEEQELTTKYDYLPTGELRAVRDSLGKLLSVMLYDTWGRKKRIHDNDTGVTTYEYDPNSNLTAQTDSKWTTLTFEYDPLDRLTRKIYPDLSEVLYEYDDPAVSNGVGRLTRRVERGGDVSTFGYDAFGRIVNTTKEMEIDGQVAVLSVETEWDALGRQKILTYPDGFFVEYFYNEAGQLENVVGSDATIYAEYPDYNASGQFTGVILGNAMTTDYAYDPLNDRLTQLFTQTSAPSVLQNLSYGFDNVGNILDITDNLPGGALSQAFTYDDFHRLSTATQTGGYGNLSYAYDAIGNITHKGGVDLTYSPYWVHRVVSTSDGKAFTYEPSRGNMATKTEGSSVTSYEWDEDGRLIEVLENGVTKATLEYDASGDRIRKTTPDFERIYFGDLYEVETLDGTFQITKHIFAGATRVASISEEKNDVAFFGGLNQQGYAVASTQFDDTTFVGFLKKQKMRWLGFTYGEAYRTAQDFFALGLVSLVFLALMALTRMKRTRLLRFARNDSVPLLPSLRGARLGERRGNLFFAPTLYRFTARLIIFSVLLLGVLPSIPQHTAEASLPLGTFYYHGDHLGSSSIITDLNGNIVEEAVYKPFGEFHERNGSPSAKHYYTGQELDEESDLYYYGARYYDPSIARFISADTIVASPFDPQDLNRYAYVRNNPIIYVDPTGHGLWAVVGIAALIGAIIGGAATIIQGTNVAKGMLGGAISGAGGMFGFIGGATAGALNTLLFGGDVWANALIGGMTAGVAWGVAAYGMEAGWKPLQTTLIAAAAAGATAGALGAAFYGGNVAQAALIGAGVSMALAAALYGMKQAMKDPKKTAAKATRDPKEKAPYSDVWTDEEKKWHDYLDQLLKKAYLRDKGTEYANWSRRWSEAGAKLRLHGTDTFGVSEEQFKYYELKVKFEDPKINIRETGVGRHIATLVSHPADTYVHVDDLKLNLSVPIIYFDNETQHILAILPGNAAEVKILGPYEDYGISMWSRD